MIYKFQNGGIVKLQGAWSKIPKVTKALSDFKRLAVRADRRFTSKPDLEYAGIPKGERNNKFRTMKFRLTQADKDAQALWRAKRDLYSRYKAVGEKRGLEFNKYGEPVVPIVGYDTVDPETVLQSRIVKAYTTQKIGAGKIDESELPFNPVDVQQGWINYFKSPAYRARVVKNSGLKTDKEINDFINSVIENVKSVEHNYNSLPEIVEKKVAVYNPKTGDFTRIPLLVQGTEGGHYSPTRHSTLIRNARGKNAKAVFEHEDLHASLKPGTKAEQVLKDSGLIDGVRIEPDGYMFSNGLQELRIPGKLLTDNQVDFTNYVAGRDEARVRGLKILRALDEEGLPVTEDNVTDKIWNTDNDVSQLGKFTPQSRTAYIDKLFATIPLGITLSTITNNE